MKVGFSALFLLIFALIFFLPDCYATPANIPEFLCQKGLELYQQGKVDEALRQFKIALLAQPDYQPALQYINMIEKGGVPSAQERRGAARYVPVRQAPKGSVDEILNFYQKQKEMMDKGGVPLPEGMGVSGGEGEGAIQLGVPTKEKVVLPKQIFLDESFSSIAQPLEIEKGKGVVVKGSNIAKFLVTEENIVSVDKIGADELLVSGTSLGYTLVYVWDDNGRWTTEWLGVFPKPEGPSDEELSQRMAERAANFKLGYTINWWSQETGRRIQYLERSSYAWSHGLKLKGPTPYGELDSQLYVRSLRTTTDLTYFTVGLNKANIGRLQNFSLRAFDYYPAFTNMAFSGAALRGAIFTLPTLNNKLSYSAFWGREGGGRYGNLSPGLTETKDSFLEGFNASYSPNKKQNYQFSMYHGSGQDREDYLHSYALDLLSSWNLGNWILGNEIAYDSKVFAHLFNSRYSSPKLSFTAELRNIDKRFLSMIGRGWRVGQLGGTFSLNYVPSEVWNMYTNVNVYRDREYPALDNPQRWNEDFSWTYGYRFNSSTSAMLGYSLQNYLGSLSQSRYQSPTMGIYKTFKFIKDISTYLNYSHQDNQSYTSASSDYTNERLHFGLRFSLWGDLYYYINKEINWLEERYLSNYVRPEALETGLEWTGQLSNTPLSGTFRFAYHDEENTDSDLSFFPGEDYIEGYTELTYRPSNEKEVFGSCRMRNVWAEEPTVTKRMTMDFHAGMRYLWDTGVSWEAACDIEGYAFKDLNSDGLRQRDEPPVEGLRLRLGKAKSTVSDTFGYFKFKGIKGRKAEVTVDMSSVPRGYLLTVPASQEVKIVHHQTVKLYFGMMIRTEISGVIFEDANGNGKFDSKENGVAQVVVTLEDGKKAVTNPEGKYTFFRASPGEHTISLDLNSLPVYYLPKTAVSKQINLFEGTTYIHNIPLNRVEDN